MKTYLGLDVGGTKIAGACYDEGGAKLCEHKIETPIDYESFLQACATLVGMLRADSGSDAPVGMAMLGAVKLNGETAESANMPFLSGQSVRSDLAKVMKCDVRIANDADCMALAEAIDGAGKGYNSVLGYIIGTGVGSGHVVGGHLYQGPNGTAGEIGHLPLPFYDPEDGPLQPCYCGQKGCVETHISGPALARLYKRISGRDMGPPQIHSLAKSGDAGAVKTLDIYYELVAKAFVNALYAYDPDVIVIAGGMNVFEGLYTEVPKRIAKYVVAKNPVLNLKPALHGPMAGLRGAARLWMD